MEVWFEHYFPPFNFLGPRLALISILVQANNEGDNKKKYRSLVKITKDQDPVLSHLFYWKYIFMWLISP